MRPSGFRLAFRPRRRNLERNAGGVAAETMSMIRDLLGISRCEDGEGWQSFDPEVKDVAAALREGDSAVRDCGTREAGDDVAVWVGSRGIGRLPDMCA